MEIPQNCILILQSKTQYAHIYLHKSLIDLFKFVRRHVTPAVASCAVRLWSTSSSDDQRSDQSTPSPSWRHALVGLLAGSGAVLAYGLHHHKVRSR